MILPTCSAVQVGLSSSAEESLACRAEATLVSFTDYRSQSSVQILRETVRMQVPTGQTSHYVEGSTKPSLNSKH